MKITKAQKEAIVNEIARRLKKEESDFTETFNKNYKFTKEEKEFISLCQEENEMNKKINNLEQKIRDFANKLGYCWARSYSVENIKNMILKTRKSEVYIRKNVDFSEIRDKLEFATLDSSFNVEEFIKNYI